MAHSLMPAAAILVPIASAIVIYLVGLTCRRLAGPLSVIALAATFGLCVWTAAIVLFGGTAQIPLALAEGHFLALYVDALSAVLLVLIGLLGLLAAIYSLPAIPRLIEQGHGQAERVPMYYALLTLFVGTMTWACCTNNIIVLWIAVEATTLASALLVTFYWDRRSLEAGYKYLLLLTVGITFALFGCVLLYAAATGEFGRAEAVKPMLITEITRHADALVARVPSIVITAVVLLVIGFGTKAGVVPMHAWLPDAHSEAPAPVSVLLSGIVIKVGAYALARCALPFIPLIPALPVVLLVLAAAGMLGGIAACAVQSDLKRLLAYSSVSQIGYVVMGIALGSTLGLFGAFFHLLNHALAKALLFFSAGAVEHATGERSLERLGGLQAKLPFTAIAFFIGALALGGAPGLNGFLSKLTLFLAAADQRLWWVAVAAIVTGLLTLIVLVRAGVSLFMGELVAPEGANGGDPPSPMVLAMAVLAVLCVLLGVWPPLADAVIGPAADGVAAALPSVGHAAGQAVALMQP